MTHDIPARNDLGIIRDSVVNAEARLQKEEFAFKESTLFRKQRQNNLHVKEDMAKELAAMGMPEIAIRQILHLEDEIPF